MRIILIITIFVLSSCTKRVKETIGIVTPGPDEYQVQRGQSIEVPPHYYLPKPTDTPNKQLNSKSLAPQNLDEAEKALLDEVGN